MLAPNPTAATVTWPVPGDVSDLLVIVGDQAETITAQASLLEAYQGVLGSAQSPPALPPATGNGAITSGPVTSIVVSGVAGTIANGALVTDTGGVVPVGTTVLGQVSGPAGSNGTYLLSVPVTFAAVTALTFTPPVGPSPWPVPRDAQTLDLIVQQQTAIIRVQTALIQHYQDLLNTSEVPAPPVGP